MKTISIKAILLPVYCCLMVVPYAEAFEQDKIAEVLRIKEGMVENGFELVRQIDDWSYRDDAMLFRRPE